MTYSGAFLAEADPFRASREEAALEKVRGEDGWGPRRPKRKAGDAWILVGAVVGIIAGAALGYLVNFAVAVIGFFAGGVLGALVGSRIASVARARRKARLLRERQSAGRRQVK